jgi:hypothetical protein
MMKNTFKIIAIAANVYLLELVLRSVLPESEGGFIRAEPISIALGVGTLLSSLFGGNKKPDVVKRDPEAEYEAMYKTKLKYADPMYEADKKYTPKYTDLELANQERSLFGTQGGQAGVLDMLTRAQPQIDEMTRKSTEYQREGDVRDVEELGPRATAAFRDSAGTTDILDKLKSSAEEGLSGDILNPRLRREFNQSVRQGQSARGKGYGIGDIAEESAFTAMQAQQLQQEDRRYAQSVVGTLQATSVDPFMAILGRPGQAMAAGAGAFGQAGNINAGAGPSGMFGMDSYFEGVGDYNANAENAGNIAGYNAQQALYGGMIQAGGSLLGAYGKGNMKQGKGFFGGQG